MLFGLLVDWFRWYNYICGDYEIEEKNDFPWVKLTVHSLSFYMYLYAHYKYWLHNVRKKEKKKLNNNRKTYSVEYDFVPLCFESFVLHLSAGDTLTYPAAMCCHLLLLLCNYPGPVLQIKYYIRQTDFIMKYLYK